VVVKRHDRGSTRHHGGVTPGDGEPPAARPRRRLPGAAAGAPPPLATTVWGRELAELLRRPAALALKLGYPLVVGVPLLWSTAPSFYASMAITMLAATLAGLGTAAVLARERASGLQLRYRLLPRPAGSLLTARLLAFAAVDLAQLLPLLALVALRHPAAARWWPAVLLTLAGTLLAANALGALASSLAASPGEVMLWVMLPLLPAFYLSGLFLPPAGPMAVVARLLPFSYLHDALDGALGGRPAIDPAAAAVAGLAFLLLSAASARAIGRRVLEAGA
jgi:ABC-type multidrug transport system permease subunit